MRPPNDAQKGAFFSVLAAVLIVVLTVMAMRAVDQRQQPRIVHFYHAHTLQTAGAEAPEHGR